MAPELVKAVEQRSLIHDEVALALLAWQETANEACLERLVSATTPQLAKVARRVLKRHHVDDWSAVDDILALVLDHLWRLPVATTHERPVARFDATRTPRGGNGDPGVAYLTWLVQERALDVVRKRRRQAARETRLAERGTAGDCCDGAPWRDSSSCGEIEADRTTRLRAAIGRLEPRLRTVVELLLEGKSQAVIAHALDVCEGTVSRLRSRAVAELRRMTE